MASVMPSGSRMVFVTQPMVRPRPSSVAMAASVSGSITGMSTSVP